MRATGRCECTAVQYRVDGEMRAVYNCHCGRCRRFTGHHMAATAVDPDHVTIVDSDASLVWYSPDPTVQYGFCGRCGSSLFWRTGAHPEKLCITAGSMDQPTGLRTTTAWWMSEHGDYHVPQPDLIEHSHDG